MDRLRDKGKIVGRLGRKSDEELEEQYTRPYERAKGLKKKKKFKIQTGVREPFKEDI